VNPDPRAPGRRHRPEFSVIVPVLNEARCIESQIERLTELGPDVEVIVVDGQSSDQTVQLASDHGVRVVHSKPGRSRQMNAGAAQATGAILVFLHADVALPSESLDWIRRTLARPGVVAGAFRTNTVWDSEAGGSAWVSPLLHLADLRSRYSRLPYGDQALFLEAETFRAVGGYPQTELMEDLELSRRLSVLGKIRTVPATVRVSGRRFQSRPIAYTVLVNVLPVLYRVGVPARILSKLYGQVR